MHSPYSLSSGGGRRTALPGQPTIDLASSPPEGGGMEASLHCVALFSPEGDG